MFLVVTGRRGEKVAAQTTAKMKSLIKNLEPDEQSVFSLVSGSGAIFQSELVEKSGMTNVVILKQ